MKVFIIYSVGENIFLEKEIIENFLKKFSIISNFTKIGCINGYQFDTSESVFVEILPILNGLIGKYFFYSSIFYDLKVNKNDILGKSILDFEYDEKLVNENNLKISKIYKELESELLITNSKKEEYLKNILDSIYQVVGFSIKLFFLLDEIITNKNDLQKIINDKNGFEEYRNQAILLDKLIIDKTQNIKIKLDLINLYLENFSSILYKYSKNICVLK